MANNTKNHQLPIWTEVEYTALCKNPFIDTPFFIPKESKVFLCREDGSREEQRMIFLVFKSTAAAEDAEWEDDPIPGELWVKPLEDDDTEEYEPAKIIYLVQDIDDFINVVSEDEFCLQGELDFSQLVQHLMVPLLIPPDFILPELGIRFRNHVILASLMSMPEASIHQNAGAILPQYNIRFSRQPWMIEPIPESPSP